MAKANRSLVLSRPGVPVRFTPAAPVLPPPLRGPWWEALRESWLWLVLLVLALGLMGFAWGYILGDYSVMARWVVSRAPELAKPAAEKYSTEGLEQFVVRMAGDLRSHEFIEEVVAAAPGGLTAPALGMQSEMEADAVLGRFILRIHGGSAPPLVETINAYATKSLQRIRTIWESEVARQRQALDDQIAIVDQERQKLREGLQLFQTTNAVIDAEREYADALDKKTTLESRMVTLGAQLQADEARAATLLAELQKHNPSLQGAQEALNQARMTFTDEHPRVKSLRAALAQMEAEVSAGSWLTNRSMMSVTNTLTVGLFLRYLELKTQASAATSELQSLSRIQDELHERLQLLAQLNLIGPAWKAQSQALADRRNALVQQRQSALLLESQAASYSRMVEMAAPETVSSARKWSLGLLAGGALGLLGAVGGLLWLGIFPGADARIRSAKELAEVSGLSVLASLPDLRRMDKAARAAWANETLTNLKAHVCGTQKGLVLAFVSSVPREGRTTWIKLLAEAACDQGYRVVMVSGESTATESSGDVLTNLPAVIMPGALTVSAPSVPVCIPLAGWMWQWQHRRQFQQALANSTMIENLALFVELPAYSTPGGATLAPEVPNLVWLCGHGQAGRRRTRSQLETLRLAGGRPAGAVFNRAARAARALVISLLLAGLAGSTAFAQENKVVPIAPKVGEPALSASGPEHLADWQKNLTLGPGDVLNISMYGQTDTMRAGVAVGPDGRINYLQARDLLVTGLTVQGLRSELEKVLAKYHLAPQVMINPVAYRSKKYYLMGNVAGKGIQPLDRPTTVIEAIAKAKGFITAPQFQNVALMVDLPRSFLVRRGASGAFARVAVDFEALFLRGDLKQNIPLAPEDVLFFPPPGLQEVYVLGAVHAPGVLPFTKDLTTLGAIVMRGGFAEKAWQSRVLVIRGSLTKPEPFVVDMAGVLKAQNTDFRLANRDIVYVHKRPWAKAEELLEDGILTFAQAAVTAYTGNKIGPFIQESLVK